MTGVVSQLRKHSSVHRKKARAQANPRPFFGLKNRFGGVLRAVVYIDPSLWMPYISTFGCQR